MVEHTDLFRKYFMSTEATLGSAKFAALHRAMVSNGTFLFVPRGVEIEQPIEIFHWLRHDNVRSIAFAWLFTLPAAAALGAIMLVIWKAVN